MKNRMGFYWLKMVGSALVVVALCLIFQGNYEQIVGAATGFLLAMIGGDLITVFLIWREDKNKINDKGFHYNRDYYCQTLSVGGKSTVLWYEPIESQGEPEYVVEDDPKKHFELDPLLQQNFSAIMQAHRASFIANPIMIRLDDYKQEEGRVQLFTSRTAYYNDLVTNRSMDYKFNGEMTVREIYESGNFLTDLAESKMSNHIGFGAFVFYRGAMIIACRGGNATISKNKFTAGIAAGFAENDLIAAHDPLNTEKRFTERDPELTREDLFAGVLLVRLADILNLPLSDVRALHAQGKIRIHTLGFGRLIYTGGKPQFYFAIVVDDSVDLSAVNDKEALRKKKQRIDYNKGMVFATRVSLVKEGGYQLMLEFEGGHTMKGEAEKSFFINWWHLKARPPIEGVPEWMYD